MHEDFDYEPITCDENDLKIILNERRKEKEKIYVEKIHNYVISILITYTMTICYLYLIILKKYYNFEVYATPPFFTGPPIGYSELSGTYKKYFEPILGIFQYGAFSIIKIIPSKIICIILTPLVGIALIFSAKVVLIDWLPYFKDVPILYLVFLLYCTAIALYYLFGVFTIFNNKMYEYMRKVSFISWIMPFKGHNKDGEYRIEVDKKFMSYIYILIGIWFFMSVVYI